MELATVFQITGSLILRMTGYPSEITQRAIRFEQCSQSFEEMRHRDQLLNAADPLPLCGTNVTDTMTALPKPRKILGLKSSVRPSWAVLEYRLIWNGTSGEWDVFRNGVNTGMSRRKKQSAIDLAVLAIRGDQGLSGAKTTVVSVKDALSKVEWQGS